jgi:hypothetical protein
LAISDAALRDAPPADLTSLHAPRAVAVGRFDRRIEPLLNQPQHVGDADADSKSLSPDGPAGIHGLEFFR